MQRQVGHSNLVIGSLCGSSSFIIIRLRTQMKCGAEAFAELQRESRTGCLRLLLPTQSSSSMPAPKQGSIWCYSVTSIDDTRRRSMFLMGSNGSSARPKMSFTFFVPRVQRSTRRATLPGSIGSEYRVLPISIEAFEEVKGKALFESVGTFQDILL